MASRIDKRGETHETERVVQAVISLTKERKAERNTVEANIIQFGCWMKEKKTKERGLRGIEKRNFSQKACPRSIVKENA